MDKNINMSGIEHVYIVTGSRNASDVTYITDVLSSYFVDKDPNTILLIHGCCRGVDRIAATYAQSIGVKVKVYKAEWGRYRGKAGPIRNKLMLDENEQARVIAFPAVGSKGTWNCVNQAKDKGMEVDVHKLGYV